MSDFKTVLERVRKSNPDLSYIEARKLASSIVKKEQGNNQPTEVKVGKKKKSLDDSINGNDALPENNPPKTIEKPQPKVIYLDAEENFAAMPTIPTQPSVASYSVPQEYSSDVGGRLKAYVAKTGVKVIVSGRLSEVGISESQVRGRTFVIFNGVKIQRNTTSDINWKIVI